MADKILRQENDQFLHKDLVAFEGKVSVGYTGTITDQIPSGDLPLTFNIGGADGISIPAGDNDVDRPDGLAVGLPIIRYNTTDKYFEGYYPEDDKWEELGGGGGGYMPDINITSFNSSTSLIEFDAPATDYAITLSWVIDRTPTTVDFTSEYGTSAQPATTTGSVGDNYTVTNTTGAEVSKTWSLNVESDSYEGSTDSSNRSAYWVYPYYYGTSSVDYSSGGVEALTKVISRRSSRTVAMDATNEFMYYAYPASYADLSSIKDGNGFEVIGSFSQSTANVTGASGVAISYKIYKLISVTTINQNFTFTI